MNGEKYGWVVLRAGMSLVMLWFGFSQIMNATKWINLIPEWTSFLGAPETIVLYNGAFEILAGILLFLGMFTRIVSSLLALHLFSILFTVGYGPTGVRDFGLCIAFLSLALANPKFLSIDAYFEVKPLPPTTV